MAFHRLLNFSWCDQAFSPIKSFRPFFHGGPIDAHEALDDPGCRDFVRCEDGQRLLCDQQQRTPGSGPTQDENLVADVYEIVQHLRRKGSARSDLRFPRSWDRVIELHEAFRRHQGVRLRRVYQGVYPVKTNQMKEVVEEIVRAGAKYHYGLEAGSKPS